MVKEHSEGHSDFRTEKHKSKHHYKPPNKFSEIFEQR